MAANSRGQHRLEVITRQLTAASLDSCDGLVDAQAITRTDVAALTSWLCHDNIQMRAQIMEFLKDDLYKPNYYLSLLEFRELTLQRLQKFVDQRFFSVRDYMTDPRRFIAALETLSFCDYSLGIKAGVHFTLCGGTICKLGTAKHHEKFLPGIDDLSTPGCFGMTELGHGSNVMGIETQATYDAAHQEFVITTPTNTASKFWIGGAGQHGKVCTVFAQLTVNGRWEGPHVFVVRIRDDAGQLSPGVRIKDNGPKMGLNGVDNGQIWFDGVRVPRDALLDAFASVDESGRYSSSIPSVSARFGTMVGGLTTGRILIGQGAIDTSKIGLTIAIRYAAQRPQFGDRLIMDYLTHQRRLLPALANTYALHIAMGDLKDVFERKRPEDAKLIHVVSSGLKAAATWSKSEALQAARECCGGMGFLAANKIGPMKTDTDVDVTFEGDNTVMMQQVARALMDDKERSKAAASAVASATPISLTSGVTIERLLSLLRLREAALLAALGFATAAAVRGAAASGGKGTAAAAAAAAYEDNLDRAVALGWANVDLHCAERFAAAVAKAPAGLAPALRALQALHAASRVEREVGTYLAMGVLKGADVEALRAAVNGMCRALGSNGAAPALLLCAAFGVPDHLIGAPIAFEWRKIGME